MKNAVSRKGKGFFAGGLIGALGGLIGLGGAEFRLPVLIGIFRLPTLEAVIFNKAMSLAVVAASFIFRMKTIPAETIFANGHVVINLLMGSLVGAWYAAGHAMTMSRSGLNRVIIVLLAILSLVMLTEALFGLGNTHTPLFDNSIVLFIAGLVAGFLIGIVAALLGVAGGELLIPTIVLLFGIDIKLAGSLSLAVSLPTMIVGFFRYSQSNSFAVLKNEKTLFIWMLLGSLFGAGVGSLFLGVIPSNILLGALGIILAISAIKTAKHMKQ